MATSIARLSNTTAPWGDELPLVGRRSERDALRLALDDALDGRGHTIMLVGEAGVGKSRLLATLEQEAHARGMLVASGRAFSVESGVPYGAIADALTTPLRAFDASTLTVLARGADADLHGILPAVFADRAASRHVGAADNDGRARQFWNVAQFLARLAERNGALLLLDNAQWSDPSSLELLHFVARQLAKARVLIVLAYTDLGLDTNPSLRRMVQSLTEAREATSRNIEPLTRLDLAELLQRSFSLGKDEASPHADALYERTRGNCFFVEHALKALLAASRIRHDGSQWIVEDVTSWTLPATAREAVRTRIEALSRDARRVADAVSVLERPATLTLLERLAGLESGPLADAIDELCHKRLLTERRDRDDASYEFTHPILHEIVRGELSAARERALHAEVAATLESMHGDDSLAHASEIARHLVRGRTLGGDQRALRYLLTAGRDALRLRADEEASRWLNDALAIAEQLQDAPAKAETLELLGVARRRLGDSAGSVAACLSALEYAESAGDGVSRARLLLEIGQEVGRAGDASRGLEYLEQAELAASAEQRDDLVVHVLVMRAKTLQSMGRSDDATRTMFEALAIAERRSNPAELARVHQTLLQLYAWTGPASKAREHGTLALELAQTSGDREVAWAAHWAMAMLEGFTGAADRVVPHVQEATRIATELSSPVLHAMIAEMRIEHASVTGNWDEGIALAERTIPIARAVAPQSLLPRLLVWTGLMVLARDETERAHDLFDEAWKLSGADNVHPDRLGDSDRIHNVNNVILAHTGLGTYWLTRGAWARALEYGERGLALADRFGFVSWAIHRLIPLVLEAGLWLQEFDRVEALTVRLREQSLALNHRLGLAWATAADALVARLKYHAPDAASRLLAAADDLDAVPFVFHAARLRRNAAQLMEADGDIAGAVRELRRAHDVFAKLGAEMELRGARSQLRSLGVRLPPKNSVQGAGALTGRELEIARAVARRLSNKEIGAAFDISSRTVSTHLSHIFVKLGVDSRGALADFVRADPLLRDDAAQH